MESIADLEALLQTWEKVSAERLDKIQLRLHPKTQNLPEWELVKNQIEKINKLGLPLSWRLVEIVLDAWIPEGDVIAVNQERVPKTDPYIKIYHLRGSNG